MKKYEIIYRLTPDNDIQLERIEAVHYQFIDGAVVFYGRGTADLICAFAKGCWLTVEVIEEQLGEIKSI